MLVPAASYLTYAEAVALYHDLHAMGIVALVKSAGPPTLPYGEGLYYQLWIDSAEADAAQGTLAAFGAARTNSLPSNCCPRCGHPDPPPHPGPAWWQRLFYAGTTLHQCPTCGANFAV